MRLETVHILPSVTAALVDAESGAIAKLTRTRHQEPRDLGSFARTAEARLESRWGLIVLYSLALLFLLGAIPRPAYLVKDINPTATYANGYLGESAAIGDTLIFTTSSGLWRSDGTAAGTFLLRDHGSYPGPYFLTACRGAVCYADDDGTHGLELWRTNGTPEGTVLVRDIHPGPHGSIESSLIPFRGQLYFWADDGTNRLALWKTDGTTEGTLFVDTMTVAPVNRYFTDGVVIDDSLYFIGLSGRDPAKPYGLFRTDGTAPGTRLMRDFAGTYYPICPGPCFPVAPGGLVELNGKAYFAASDGISGLELWSSDGTTDGTRMVSDICPGPCGGFESPGGLLAFRGRLYFGADDGIHGKEVWTSGGTPGSTVLLKDIEPTSTGSEPGSSYPGAFTPVGDLLLFGATETTHGSELWRTDGTEAGTVLVKDINPGASSSYLYGFVSTGSVVYFSANDGDHGYELWRSDGTFSGTVPVADIFPGPTGSDPSSVRLAGRELYLGASGADGFGLWRTDGSAAGTSAVRVISSSASSSLPLPLAELDGTLIFSASDGTSRRLWRSDGSPAGTTKLADVAVELGFGSFGNASAVLGGKLYFDGDFAALWKTDGTEAGTAIVKSARGPDSLTVVGDTLFFTAFGDHGQELWKSDGTEGGTTLVEEIDPDSRGTYASSLTASQGLLYFAKTGVDLSLWRSDGTASGTRLVRSVFAQELLDFGGALFFSGGSDSEGRGLWRSDGTPDGTRLVKTFEEISRMVVTGPTLFILELTASYDARLWRSDGTAEGTFLLKEFSSGFAPDDLVAVGTRLFFAAGDSDHGRELWSTDGTPQGTAIVKDIVAGAGDSGPTDLTNAGSVLVFSARDGIHGVEVWKSDGTEAGTSMVADIVRGPGSSSPSAFAPAGSRVYFSADDGVSGREIWAVPASALQDKPGRPGGLPRLVQPRL